MNIKLLAAGAAFATLVPLVATAQEEWAAKQQAGWQPTQSQDGSAAAVLSRSVMIDEGNIPVGASAAGRFERSEAAQDSADDSRNRPALDTASLYFGG